MQLLTFLTQSWLQTAVNKTLLVISGENLHLRKIRDNYPLITN